MTRLSKETNIALMAGLLNVKGSSYKSVGGSTIRRAIKRQAPAKLGQSEVHGDDLQTIRGKI